jgi:hypothetical protein
VATVLYTALADLEVRSPIASWPWKSGHHAPLDPAKSSTIALLAAGKIELAPDNAVDDTTPAHVERGMPGVKVGVSN